MFIVNNDLSIYATRGDTGIIPVPMSDLNGKYKIQVGDVLRIKVFPKKNCENVVLQKDFNVLEDADTIELELLGSDTKIGEVISKPTTYWYEIELNPDTYPQTIVGYDEEGPKIFLLYPEGDDTSELPSINTGRTVNVSDEAVESIINNELFLNKVKSLVGDGDFSVSITIDSEMSDTSENPVQNKVAKAYIDKLAKKSQIYVNDEDNKVRTDVDKLIEEFVVLKEEGKGLSTNDFTDEYVEKLNNLDNENSAIPDYWQTALDNGVDAIRQAMETAGRNKSAFLFYSDAHWDYGSQMSPTLLKYLYKNTAMTKTFFGGDIVNSESSDRTAMKYLYEWREMLKGLPNHHSVVGNHDDGNVTNNLFSAEYIYAYLLAPEETPNMVLGDGMYYYIDEPCEKTRYLFLDTAYKGVDTAQIEFITEALKSTQSGWHIVVISHIWYQPDYDQYSVRPIPIDGLDTNAEKVIALLDNYNSRIGNFADCDGWVEFCIGGHVHRDYDGTTTTGIPIILVETDSQHIRSDLSYTAGTTTESSVNGIIADYENHMIYVVRIGRGESREIEVTNYVIKYTNRLPLAVDVDGTTIYNVVGYKADTRWSATIGAETEADGIYLSGYIPCSHGDVIRLKNITMPNEDSNACSVHWYTSLGVRDGNHNAANLTTYNGAVWDDNNNLVQFTVSSNVEYIRIQCAYMDETSIITVNEVIE